MFADPALEAARERRRARNRRKEAARATGAAWEAEVDRQMVRLRDAGRILSVHRNYPPYRQVGPAKRGVMPVRVMGTGAPDWHVAVPGALILGDDKHTDRQRFHLDNIKPHQADSFDAWQAGGGFSVLLVRTPAGRWCLDWRRVGPIYRRMPSGSLSEEQLDACGARFTDDWLTAWESCR